MFESFIGIVDYNLVMELPTRTDLERKRFADIVISFRAVAGICDEVVADMLLITIGWHISVMGRVVPELRDDEVVNERHLATSRFKSFRCAARPAAANGNGTNR